MSETDLDTQPSPAREPDATEHTPWASIDPDEPVRQTSDEQSAESSQVGVGPRRGRRAVKKSLRKPKRKSAPPSDAGKSNPIVSASNTAVGQMAGLAAELQSLLAEERSNPIEAMAHLSPEQLEDHLLARAFLSDDARDETFEQALVNPAAASVAEPDIVEPPAAPQPARGRGRKKKSKAVEAAPSADLPAIVHGAGDAITEATPVEPVMIQPALVETIAEPPPELSVVAPTQNLAKDAAPSQVESPAIAAVAPVMAEPEPVAVDDIRSETQSDDNVCAISEPAQSDCFQTADAATNSQPVPPVSEEAASLVRDTGVPPVLTAPADIVLDTRTAMDETAQPDAVSYRQALESHLPDALASDEAIEPGPVAALEDAVDFDPMPAADEIAEPEAVVQPTMLESNSVELLSADEGVASDPLPAAEEAIAFDPVPATDEPAESDAAPARNVLQFQFAESLPADEIVDTDSIPATDNAVARDPIAASEEADDSDAAPHPDPFPSQSAETLPADEAVESEVTPAHAGVDLDPVPARDEAAETAAVSKIESLESRPEAAPPVATVESAAGPATVNTSAAKFVITGNDAALASSATTVTIATTTPIIAEASVAANAVAAVETEESAEVDEEPVYALEEEESAEPVAATEVSLAETLPATEPELESATDTEAAPVAAATGGGWTIPLMCLGIGLAACCLAIPQIDLNRRLHHEQQNLQVNLAAVEKQVAVNDEFLKKVMDDPTLAERLAGRQLKTMRKGQKIVPLRQVSEDSDMSPFALVAVAPPPPPAPYKPIRGTIADICNNAHARLYLLGFAMTLVAVGLVMGCGFARTDPHD
jgi:hypothetical protein